MRPRPAPGALANLSAIALYGLVLAGGVLAVAFLLVGRQWAEHRQAASVESDEDVAHFRRQSLRRSTVSGIMVVLALLILIGTRTPHRLADRPNPVFLLTWLVAFALVILLLVLAGADWLATRNYALRQRRAIVREGIEILREELERRARPPTNGRAAGD